MMAVMIVLVKTFFFNRGRSFPVGAFNKGLTGQVRARQQLLQNGRLPFYLGSSEIGFNHWCS